MAIVRIEEVKDIISNCILRGMSTSDIHQSLERRGFDITYTRTSRYCSEIKRGFKERRKMLFDERFDLELAVHEKIRTAALDGYENSIRGTVVTESETVMPVSDPLGQQDAQQDGMSVVGAIIVGRSVQPRTTTKEKHTSSSGDPRFLDVALRASEKISKMLDLDPVETKRVEHVSVNPRIDEYKRMEAAELNRLIAEEIGKSHTVQQQ